MRKKRGQMSKAAKNEAMWAWAFILPTIIGLIILNYIPAVQTIYQSFCKTGDFGKGNIFVGLENYTRAFADSRVWQSLWNTIKYALIEVPFGVIISLILAVFLNDKAIKGKSFFRTIFFRRFCIFHLFHTWYSCDYEVLLFSCRSTYILGEHRYRYKL